MMNLSWGDPYLSQFVTNVGLVTSYGPNGHNIMSCEWTHMIAYAPALIGIAVGPQTATAENIFVSKEFGINIAAEDQALLSAIAGNNSGHTVDKTAVLKELGFKFYNATTINTLMVKDACINAECKVVEVIERGDKRLIIGEIVSIKNIDKKPLLYHQTKYFNVGNQIPKPDVLGRSDVVALLQKYKK